MNLYQTYERITRFYKNVQDFSIEKTSINIRYLNIYVYRP